MNASGLPTNSRCCRYHRVLPGRQDLHTCTPYDVTHWLPLKISESSSALSDPKIPLPAVQAYSRYSYRGRNMKLPLPRSRRPALTRQSVTDVASSPPAPAMPSLHVRQASLSHRLGFLITTCAALSLPPVREVISFCIVRICSTQYHPTPADVPWWATSHRLQNPAAFQAHTLEAAGPPTSKRETFLPAFRSDSREISSRSRWMAVFARDTGSGFRAVCHRVCDLETYHDVRHTRA